MPPTAMIPHPQQLATAGFPMNMFPPQDLSMFTSLNGGEEGEDSQPGYHSIQQPTSTTASFLGLPYDAVHEG